MAAVLPAAANAVRIQAAALRAIALAVAAAALVAVEQAVAAPAIARRAVPALSWVARWTTVRRLPARRPAASLIRTTQPAARAITWRAARVASDRKLYGPTKKKMQGCTDGGCSAFRGGASPCLFYARKKLAFPWVARTTCLSVRRRRSKWGCYAARTTSCPCQPTNGAKTLTGASL
jgi:hypothetical protein